MKPSSYVALSLLFSTLLFGFFLVNDRGFLQVRRHRQRLAAIQAEVSALARENERLEAEVKALRTDPNAVEKTAREDLNLVKPDEVVLVLPPKWRERVAARHPGSPR